MHSSDFSKFKSSINKYELTLERVKLLFYALLVCSRPTATWIPRSQICMISYHINRLSTSEPTRMISHCSRNDDKNIFWENPHLLLTLLFSYHMSELVRMRTNSDIWYENNRFIFCLHVTWNTWQLYWEVYDVGIVGLSRSL